jgi:hypothetical protein
MTAGYEAVREASRRYDAHAKRASEGRISGDDMSRKPFPFPSFSPYEAGALGQSVLQGACKARWKAQHTTERF